VVGIGLGCNFGLVAEGVCERVAEKDCQKRTKGEVRHTNTPSLEALQGNLTTQNEIK
jgi:hypothetical protein